MIYGLAVVAKEFPYILGFVIGRRRGSGVKVFVDPTDKRVKKLIVFHLVWDNV
jgi:hypothetical protein